MRPKQTEWKFSASFFVLLLCGYLLDPLALCAIIIAAFAHECGHIIMMRIFRTPIERVRLGAFGAEIVSSRFLRLPYGREMLITAAGVFMNLLCAFSFAEISHLTQTDFFYILSGANAVTAILNILPMQPLDGGRLLYLLIARFSDPIRAESVCGIVGRTISVMLFLCAAILYAKGLAGLLFVFAAIGLFFCQFPQVSLAKSVVRV